MFSCFAKDNIDTYATTDPQQAFHKRITFCMDVHNEAVKVKFVVAQDHLLLSASHLLVNFCL